MKKIINAIKNLKALFRARMSTVVCDATGDAGVETLGKIIIALVLVAAVIAVVRLAAPTMFANLFDGVADKIADLWN